jgi:hypothetical protein
VCDGGKASGKAGGGKLRRQAVARSYHTLTSHPPKAIGTVLPYSYTANDTYHLWKTSIPCVLYGPGVIRGNQDEDDSYVLISEMVTVTKVLSLTALDVCNRESRLLPV